jgi:hypothetical protein
MEARMAGLLTLLLLWQSPSTTDWKQGPRWQPGQEYLYRGVVKHTGQAGDAQILEQYILEVRLLVTKVQGSSAELVCATKLTVQSDTGPEATPSVQLTFLHVDQRGHITSSTASTGKSIVVDGPATFENGFLLPLPAEAIVAGKAWEASEPGRLPHKLTWIPATSEDANDVITSVQESYDWQRPRGDQIAWQRTDTLHMSSNHTLPMKVSRVIERRPPGHRQATSRIVTEYKLMGLEIVRGPMLEERLTDIDQLRSLQYEVATLSQAIHDRQTQRAWTKLSAKLKSYQMSSGKTPYREALSTLLQTTQDGLDNRLSPVKHEVAEKPIEVGQLVPPFSLTTTNGETLSSKQLRGKPCVLVFVQAGTALTRTLCAELTLELKRCDRQRFSCCLLLSKPDTLRETNSSFPVAVGQSLLSSFSITATPCVIVLDADGTLIYSQEGWGVETRQDLIKLLQKEIAKGR